MIDAQPPKNTNIRLSVLAIMIVVAALTRVLPHAWNFTPIFAMAIFGGAYLQRRSLAIAVPLAAMLLSDLFIGFHQGMPMVYGTIAACAILGMMFLRSKQNVGRIAGAGLGSCLLFFLVTNGAIWLSGGTPTTCQATLMDCYAVALPFLKNNLLGTAVWSVVLFGGFALLTRQVPALRNTQTAAA